MVPRRGGSIIYKASTSDVMGSVVFPAYSVSTTAVLVIVHAVAGNHAMFIRLLFISFQDLSSRSRCSGRSSLGSGGRMGRERGLDPQVDPV
jgi:hypothetical protein